MQLPRLDPFLPYLLVLLSDVILVLRIIATLGLDRRFVFGGASTTVYAFILQSLCDSIQSSTVGASMFPLALEQRVYETLCILPS